jgi:hypothetical protein
MVEADNNTFLGDLLRAWASAPASAFFRLCRKHLTGKAVRSHPERLAQCEAIRVLATRPQVKPELETLLETAWPTLLAIVDGGGEPLHVAAMLGVELLLSVPDANLRERLERELDECLIDVIEHGRNDWSGLDPHAKVAAADAGGCMVRPTPAKTPLIWPWPPAWTCCKAAAAARSSLPVHKPCC